MYWGTFRTGSNTTRTHISLLMTKRIAISIISTIKRANILTVFNRYLVTLV